MENTLEKTFKQDDMKEGSTMVDLSYLVCAILDYYSAQEDEANEEPLEEWKREDKKIVKSFKIPEALDKEVEKTFIKLLKKFQK